MHFIGRSDTIAFTCIAGDIKIPQINPLIACPSPKASSPVSEVSVKDTIPLTGICSDQYGGHIIKWEWDAGNRGTFTETPDSNCLIIAPPTTDTNYQCVLRVTDDDSNVVSDTLSMFVYFGKVADIDGNIYHTIKIGNQEWTVENLRVTKLNDGEALPFVTDGIEWQMSTTPAYCLPNLENCRIKANAGALYNWYALKTDKLPPAGWHVSTRSDWDTLVTYLIANGYN